MQQLLMKQKSKQETVAMTGESMTTLTKKVTNKKMRREKEKQMKGKTMGELKKDEDDLQTGRTDETRWMTRSDGHR